MPIQQSNPPGKRREGGTLFEEYVTVQDRKHMAKSPLTWFVLTGKTGAVEPFTKSEVSALMQHCRKLQPRNFRMVSRSASEQGKFNVWIQFNPGHWERLAQSEKNNDNAK